MKLDKLPRSFYARPALVVARDLLGKYFVRRIRNHHLIGKIVEVEAYRGRSDPASHAYRGKTPRNAVMYGRPGHLYVYFTYGMHFCCNVVTDGEGKAGAVLIRAVEPVAGTTRMRNNRRGVPDHNLTNGPAKFCEAFDIERKENGVDLLGCEMWITEGERIHPEKIGRSVRIGIRVAADKLWRFYVKGNPWVSK